MARRTETAGRSSAPPSPTANSAPKRDRRRARKLPQIALLRREIATLRRELRDVRVAGASVQDVALEALARAREALALLGRNSTRPPKP